MEENQDVKAVVEPTPTPSETPEVAQEVHPQENAPSVEKDNTKEYNFKQLRDENERLKAELSAKNEPPPMEQPRDFRLQDDELVEGRQFNEAIDRLEERMLQKEQEEVPNRLRAKYADFDDVVSPENVQRFKNAEPELFEALQVADPKRLSGRETYSKGLALYQLMQQKGFRSTSMETKKIEENQQKPLSAQALPSAKSSEALSDANYIATHGFTAELKKKYYTEALEASKRA